MIVPLNLTFLHCLQHSFFEYLFKLYYGVRIFIENAHFSLVMHVNSNMLASIILPHLRYGITY